MTSEYGNILERGSRLRKLLAASATALVLGVAAASPSWAAIDPQHVVTVFPDRDMVVAEDYDPNTPIQVEVLRNGVVIGQTDPAGETADAGGVGILEVNHGPVGAPQPGDCWVGTTPDIQGNDVIRITTPDGVETMDVADVAITTGPTENLDGNIIVEGRAATADGGQIPEGELAEEVRDLTPRWRGEPDSFGFVGATTSWQAVYASPFADNAVQEDNGTTEAGRKDSILSGEHSIIRTNGLSNEITISEFGATGGPAPGCDAPLASNDLTTVAPNVVNAADVAANRNVTVSGVIQDGIDVSLGLNGNALGAVTPNRTANTFSATIPAANLVEGNNNVTATFSGPGAPAQPQTRSVQKDTTAPANPTATPDGGFYNGNQSVTLDSAEAGSTIRYTTGPGTQADPTATTGLVYSGQIPVADSQTIKAIVVDASGNPSNVSVFQYTIDKIAPGISANLASDSYTGAQSLVLSSEAGAEIFYTTDGSAPDRSSQAYNGPINVTSSQQIRAIAYDQAGNASNILDRNITIRTASTTTLNVATADLKLGRSRTIAGSVSPRHAGEMVKITIDRPGTLSNMVRNVQLDSASRYGFSYTPNTPGVYRVTVSFTDTDNLHLDSASAMRSFRVIR